MATVYYPDCPTGELPFYQCDPCANYEKGRARSGGFVSDAYYPTLIANPTSTALWQAGIESEDIIIIPKTTGTLDAPDPITGSGYGDDVETILGRDYVLTLRDPNYIGNCNFYNTLRTKNGVFHAIYRTGSQTHITPETVVIDARAPITENTEDNIEWNVTATWRSEVQPCPFVTPVGIFDCFGLTEP